MMELVSRYFEKTVVLINTGNIIDMSWVETYHIKSVMYIWQGGQDGGNAAADLLCGNVTPSGKLTDTIAKHIDRYPSVKNFRSDTKNFYEEDIYVGYRYFETFAKGDVLYPFGFGLSYTTFHYENIFATEENGKIKIDVNIKNTGNFSGKEIVQVYFEAPQGRLGKSARELCAFAKTRLLLPDECETLCMEFNIDDMAAYDDSGATGNKSCYVLEAGDYNIYAGCCVRCAKKVFTYTQNDLKIVKQLTEALAPVDDLNIMHPVLNGDKYEVSYKKAPKRTVDYDKRILDNLPKEIAPTGDKGIKLIDVKDGKNTMEEFVAQLSDEDLAHLVCAEGMQSPKIRAGSVGAIGGLTPNLNKLGIPITSQHDGPSGIRMDSGDHATSIPAGTLIACSWNTELCEKLYEALSVEMCAFSVDCLLGPGINIHRVPLCGRNFEYFSEDPYVTGKIATAVVKGIAKYGNSGTFKHFAANNQEQSRHRVDAVVSERALREIYLKAFEMVVKSGYATTLMTSYNPINGRWSVNNYELNTTILRDEWGYDGMVMTDWWPTTQEEAKPEIKNLKDMVRAQNDVYACARDVLTFKNNILSSLKNGELTRGELQRNAMNILTYIMHSRALTRFIEQDGNLAESLSNDLDALETIQTYNHIANEEDTYYVFPYTGKVLFAIDYESDKSELIQMILNITINDMSAGCLSVNGTDGGTVRVYADITVTERRSHMKFFFPEQIKIKKVDIMVKKDEERLFGIYDL